MSPAPRVLAAAATCAVALAGCTATTTPTGTGSTIAVRSTDDACEVAPAQAPSGSIVFSVTNGGSQATEFYLYGEDGLRIVGEVEDIGPGLTRDLVVEAGPGSYVSACKPGMVGEGIRAAFTVTGSAAEPTA
jgi:iron uptake system component EfeO